MSTLNKWTCLQMDFFTRQILDVIWGAKKAFCWKASLSVGDISMLLFRMMKVTVRWRCSGGILALTFNLVKRFVRIFFLITTLIELNDMYDFLWRRQWQPTPVLLPGESQGREPGGLPSMGLHRVRHDWSDLAAAAVAWLLNKLGGRKNQVEAESEEDLLPWWSSG